MKKLSMLVFLAIGLGNVALAFGDAHHHAQNVSMISLIATPEQYQNKLVRVIGVSCIEFEGNAVYCSKEDYQYRVSKNAIWIEPDDKILKTDMKELEKWNGSYVIIEGIFDKSNMGHMGMFSGTIKNIKRYDLWERE